ncbi:MULTISPECIES: hypothetical protein [unclassified Streptomyces]|uniref:hypothetical protein n=1 Tax=unclassified Streptomyces TaxID=2593676 RepID=UPI00344CBBF9
MRQLSVPARWAAVTALTIAASTGCMSVGDDAAGPRPSRSADPKGQAVQPNGETVPGTGEAGHRGDDAHPHSDADRKKKSGKKPRPGASGAVPSVTPKGPRPVPGAPQPSRPGHPPAPTPSTPGPGEPPPVVPEPPAPPPTPAPDPEPEPEPTQPPEPPPSASPAAQLRTQSMGGADEARPWRTPEASPQVRPV